MAAYGVDFILRGYEKFARGHESALDAGCLFQFGKLRGEKPGRTGDKPPFLTDAPEVVVDETVGDDNVHDRHLVARSGSHTCIDDEFRAESVDEAHGADGCIDLTYATLHDGNLVAPDSPAMICDGTAADGRRVGEERKYQGQLLLHGHDDAYFHK